MLKIFNESYTMTLTDCWFHIAVGWDYCGWMGYHGAVIILCTADLVIGTLTQRAIVILFHPGFVSLKSTSTLIIII